MLRHQNERYIVAMKKLKSKVCEATFRRGIALTVAALLINFANAVSGDNVAGQTSTIRGECRKVVTYTAGYFMNEASENYPYFMGFVDVSKIHRNSPQSRGYNGRRSSPMGLVEWQFPNNETLLSVTPESHTKIISNGTLLDINGTEVEGLVSIFSNTSNFKFIAHRDQSQSLMAPSSVVLNREVCEEIVQTVHEHDDVVKAEAQSKQLSGRAHYKEENLLVLYQPDPHSMESLHPKIYTKFNVSVVNVGSKPIELSNISIKYWFRNPGMWFLPARTWEVTFPNCMETYGSYHNPEPVPCIDLGVTGVVKGSRAGAAPGADYVLEITFPSAERWLTPINSADNQMNLNASSASMGEDGQSRNASLDPTGILIEPALHLDFFMRSVGFFLRMNETGDYSYQMGADPEEWIVNHNITVELNNQTVWGLEPYQGSSKVDRKRYVTQSPYQHTQCGGANQNVSSSGCLVFKTFCCKRVGNEQNQTEPIFLPPPTPPPPPTPQSSSKVWIYVVSVVCSIFFLGLVSCLVIHCLKKYRNKMKPQSDNVKPFKSGFVLEESSVDAGQEQNQVNEPPSVFGGLTVNTSKRSILSTPSPQYSPTSAIQNIFKNPFTLLPASPKFGFPDTSSDASTKGMFEVVNPEDVKPLRFVGSGAFGSVYEAILEGHGHVAIKLVNIRDMSDTISNSQLEVFKREVDVLSRVDHANIVNLHGACMCLPNNVFIVMELMQGSLRDKLDIVGQMRYRDILKLANQISSALAYLHPTIVHRDLKPQNILIDSEGNAKVADFGIARFKQSTYLNTTHGNGTPAYMAPELFGSEKISEKADVFSLGMILWECWTGECPWKEVTIPFQVVMLVGVEKRRPKIPEDCPAQLSSLIQKCWDNDPHRRPSCAEVERRTRLLLHDLQ